MFTGFDCIINDSEGNLTVTTQSKATRTGPVRGTLQCRAQVTPPSSGRATVLNFEKTGDKCVLENLTTERWTLKISKSGRAILDCKFNEDDFEGDPI